MPTPDPAILQALFNQPPEDAIAYLRKKGLRITFNWFEMLDEAHARAFTVAKAMCMDILRDIRRATLNALENGQTFRDFYRDLAPELKKKGWWGKQIVVDSQGQAQQVQLGSVHRLKTIYQTNLQSAYMAGRRLAQQQASANTWLMYVAVMDNRTRPAHAALDGKIWRKDHPVWEVIDPPRGYNCRCRVRSLTEGQMQREGLRPSDPPEIVSRTIDAGTDQMTGELFPTVQRGIRVTDDTGKSITSWTDAGFNRSHLAGHIFDDLLARKAVAALGDAAGFDQVRRAVLSEPRIKAWDAFIENALKSGIHGAQGQPGPQNQTMTVGILDLAVARTLLRQNTPFAPILYVYDRLVVGAKSRRHQSAGNALSENDWISAPFSISTSDVYYDKQEQRLIQTSNLADGQTLQFAFKSNGEMVSAYIERTSLIQEKIRTGRWIQIK